MAAGRRLIHLDKELEGMRWRPVKQSEGRKGRSGAVWRAHASFIHAHMHDRNGDAWSQSALCSRDIHIHGNCVLIINMLEILLSTHVHAKLIRWMNFVAGLLHVIDMRLL